MLQYLRPSDAKAIFDVTLWSEISQLSMDDIYNIDKGCWIKVYMKKYSVWVPVNRAMDFWHYNSGPYVTSPTKNNNPSDFHCRLLGRKDRFF